MRFGWTTVLVVAVSVLLALILHEIYVRQKIAADLPVPLVVYSEDHRSVKRQTIIQSEAELYRPPLPEELQKSSPHLGHFNQNREVKVWFLDEDNRIVLEFRFRTNNMGFISDRDYSLRSEGNEYRIVVLGDSFTGTTTVHAQWVDEVETLLNHDDNLKTLLRVDSIRLYNLGEPGAGFGHFSANYFNQGKFLKPDMVLINYVESDFPRGFTPYHDLPDAEKERHTYGTGFVTYPSAREKVGGSMYVICTHPPISLQNMTCNPNSYLLMPEELVHNPVEVGETKKMILADYVGTTLRSTFVPLGLLKILGFDVSLPQLRLAIIAGTYPFKKHNPGSWDTDSQDVSRAAGYISKILDDHSNVLITLNPMFWDVFPERKPYAQTDLLARFDKRIHVIEMRDVLPLPKEEEAIKRWYNLPWDGHMSDYGGKIYSQGIACMIRQHLHRSNHVKPPPCLLSANQSELALIH